MTLMVVMMVVFGVSFTSVSVASVVCTASPTSLSQSLSVCVSTLRLKASSHSRLRETQDLPKYATSLHQCIVIVYYCYCQHSFALFLVLDFNAVL